MKKERKKSRLLFCVIIAVCLIATTPIITGLYLDDLEDVAITDVFNNQYIRYNSTSANWTNQNVSFGNPFNQDLNTTDSVEFDYIVSNHDLDVFGWTYLGSFTDFVEVSPTGVVALYGDAIVTRHVRVTAPQWVKGAEAPEDDIVNIFPTLSFDATHDDYAYFSIIVPFRMQEGSVITVTVDWCVLEETVGFVMWQLEYLSVPAYEDDPERKLDDAVVSILQPSVDGNLGYVIVRTVFEERIEGAEAHDDLGLRLTRLASEDTVEQNVHLIQVHLKFTEDKLGGHVDG